MGTGRKGLDGASKYRGPNAYLVRQVAKAIRKARSHRPKKPRNQKGRKR